MNIFQAWLRGESLRTPPRTWAERYPVRKCFLVFRMPCVECGFAVRGWVWNVRTPYRYIPVHDRLLPECDGSAIVDLDESHNNYLCQKCAETLSRAKAWRTRNIHKSRLNELAAR